MPTFQELETLALDAYNSGNVERAKKLKERALAQQEYERLEVEAVNAWNSGEEEEAKKLKKQALDTVAPFEEGRLVDVGRGILTAPVSIAQGIMEFGAAGLDISLGTEYSRPISEAFEAFKEDYDLNPNTAAGEVTEELIAFGLGFIPIAGWLGRASSVARGTQKAKASSKFFKAADRFGESKTGKALLKNRARLAGTTALATTGYETLVTPDGRATLSDSFDILPDALKTVDTSEMSGSDLAYNRLANKLRRGVEGGLASITFDAGLPVVGAAARGVGQIPGVSEVSSLTGRALVNIYGRAADLTGKIPGAQTLKDKANYWFKPGGTASSDIIEETLDAQGFIDNRVKRAVDLFRGWEKATNQFFSAVDLPKKSGRKRREIEDDLMKAFTGFDFEDATKRVSFIEEKYGKKAGTAFRKMLDENFRQQDEMITELETRIAQAKAEGISPNKQMVEAIDIMKEQRASQRGYLRRRFEMYKNPIKYYSELEGANLTELPLYKEALQQMQNTVFAKQYTPEQVEEILGRRPAELFQPDGSPTSVPLSDDLIREIAEKRLLNYIGLDVSEEGMTVQKAIRNALDKAKAMNKRGGDVIMPGRVLSITDDMFITRVKELDSMPKVMELMGEIRDPKAAFMQTAEDTAKTFASLRTYRGMAQDFAKGGMPAFRALQEGELPLIVRDPFNPNLEDRLSFQDSGEIAGDIQSTLEDTLLSRGYVKLDADETGQSLFDGIFGDLSGSYVLPSVKEALLTPARLQIDALGEAIATAAVLKGQAQRMTIIPNLASQWRNILGNGIALANNANFHRNMDFVDSFRVVAANTDNLSEEGIRRLSDELGSLGVMDSSLITKALKDFRDFARDKGGVAEFTSNLADRASSLVPFMRQLESLYGNSDSFFKVMAVFGEQGKIANAVGKLGIDPKGEVPRELYDVIRSSFLENGLAKRVTSKSLDESFSNFILTTSGDIVKDTMPVYSRVGKLVKRLDAIPVFGAFTSFASENIRNAVNTVSRGIKELSFKIDVDEFADAMLAAKPTLTREQAEAQAKAYERYIRGIGSQRLLSYTATSYYLPTAITKASMLATGTTEEELEAARVLSADFYDGAALGVLSNDGRGNMELFNQSYIFPHSFVRDPAVAALQAYNEAGELNKSQANQLLNGVWGAMKGYTEPFAGESLFAERVRDVLPTSWIGRGGNTPTGATIYREGESLGDKVSKSVAHVLGGYVPGYMNLAFRERRGEFEAGPLVRGLTGEPGRRGETYRSEEELARIFTGLSPIKINNRTNFNFAGGEYQSKARPLKTAANSEITRPDATIPETLEAWSSYLDNLYRVQSELYYKVLAAREMGTPDDVIRSQLKEANLGRSEIAAIMRGEFRPGKTAKQTIQGFIRDLMNEDKKFLVDERPWGEYISMAMDRQFEKLSPELAKQDRQARLEERQALKAKEAQEANLGLETPLPEETIQAPVAAPQANVPQVTAPAPQAPAQQQQNIMSRIPFLGSNPVDALRNLEILQRLGGGQ